MRHFGIYLHFLWKMFIFLVSCRGRNLLWKPIDPSCQEHLPGIILMACPWYCQRSVTEARWETPEPRIPFCGKQPGFSRVRSGNDNNLIFFNMNIYVRCRWHIWPCNFGVVGYLSRGHCSYIRNATCSDKMQLGTVEPCHSADVKTPSEHLLCSVLIESGGKWTAPCYPWVLTCRLNPRSSSFPYRRSFL